MFIQSDLKSNVAVLNNISIVKLHFICKPAKLYQCLKTHKKFKKALIKLISNTILKQQGYYLDKHKRKALK